MTDDEIRAKSRRIIAEVMDEHHGVPRGNLLKELRKVYPFANPKRRHHSGNASSTMRASNIWRSEVMRAVPLPPRVKQKKVIDKTKARIADAERRGYGIPESWKRA